MKGEKVMKKVRNFNFENLSFPTCRELTEEELLLVNGGKKIENSNAAVAEAQVGDSLTRNDGTTVTITQGDIDWAKKQVGSSGGQSESGGEGSSESDGQNGSETATEVKVAAGNSSVSAGSSSGSSGNSGSSYNGSSASSSSQNYTPALTPQQQYEITDNSEEAKKLSENKDSKQFIRKLDSSSGNLSNILGTVSTVTGVANVVMDKIAEHSEDVLKATKISKYSKIVSKISSATGVIALANDMIETVRKPTFKNISKVTSDVVGFIPVYGPVASEVVSYTSEQAAEVSRISIQLESKYLRTEQQVNSLYAPNSSVLPLSNMNLDYMFKEKLLQGLNMFFSEE